MPRNIAFVISAGGAVPPGTEEFGQNLAVPSIGASVRGFRENEAAGSVAG